MRRKFVWTTGNVVSKELPVLNLPTLRHHEIASSIGGVSEITCAADLLRRGCFVFWSMTPTGPYDLIADINGILVRIEVKTATIQATGQWAFQRPEDKTRYDCIAAVSKAGEVRYFPPLFLDKSTP